LSHRIKAAIAAGVAVLAVAPAGASAATKTVDMGTPISAQKALQQSVADVNDFFPHGTTIHVGDSVKFVPTAFHTVDFPAKGGKPLGLIAPAGTTSGVLDAAGAPFWFNGQPTLGFTPALGPPGLYGKKATYTGAKRVESGAPLAQKPKPFTVKFTKAGTFTYYCNIHSGMKGTVKVVSKSHSVPSAKADSKTVKAQVSSALSTAKALTKTTVAAGNVSVGASGPRGVESFAMYPATQTVPVGTTITFSMSAKTFDVHTATFGPGNPETEPTSYLGDLAKRFGEDQPFPSQAVYPSDPPPAGPAALTPTLHGNGFWNAGLLDVNKATPLPPSNAVTFAAPGTYNFYCMVHPFMHGTVVVQ
jgi:plastocyanin